MAVASTSWEVELDLFRGPLHALLDLIERRELPVTRISLVEVADQYTALVRASSLDLDLTAEFLHIAARLLLLKSQVLLPREADEEPSDDDSDAEDLEARLLAYRRFRDVARLLAARQEQGLRAFGRVAAEQPVSKPARVAVEPARLRRAATRVFARAAAGERAREAVPSPLVPFPEVLQAVVERLRGRRHTRFHDLVSEAGDVIMAITMFLAVLELVRRRQVSLRQHGLFGPIELVDEREPSDDGS